MCMTRDHPREYGENKTALWREHTHAGSSPRIRGEYFRGMPGNFRSGIIPANTGRIIKQALKPGKLRDHPREYGENGMMKN